MVLGVFLLVLLGGGLGGAQCRLAHRADIKLKAVVLQDLDGCLGEGLVDAEISGSTGQWPREAVMGDADALGEGTMVTALLRAPDPFDHRDQSKEAIPTQRFFCDSERRGFPH